MSIDMLQDRIRKLKSPIVLDLSLPTRLLPPHLLEDASPAEAYKRFSMSLLDGLKGTVAGVRFSFDQLALLGAEGLSALSELLNRATQLGCYVCLDGPQILTPWAADRAAESFWSEGSQYPCDGLVVSPYIGTDGMKPFLPYCKEGKKDLFLAVRTPNRSAGDLQDLRTGSRHVHTAAMDLLSRQGESILGRCGYSHIGALAAVTAGAGLATLRGSYNRVFLLVDGYDYPSGSAKGCTPAFDRLGHGAAISVGPAITAAWNEAETDGRDFAEQAAEAAERIRKLLLRYITIV